MSDEIANFYKTYNGYCHFIEGDNHFGDSEGLRRKNWELMKEYAANANISVFDAIDRNYVYYCHCCGQDLEYAYSKGEMYCSYECECAIEIEGYKCNFYDCLMCQNIRTDKPPFLEQINKFYYLTGCGGKPYNMSGNGVFRYRRIEEKAERYNMTMQEARSYCNTARMPDKRPMEHLPELSKYDQLNLETYANDYGVTLAEAYKAQHKCQYCSVAIVPNIIVPGHQFCSLWCEVCYDVNPKHNHCDYCDGEFDNCPACKGEVYYLKQVVMKEEELNTVIASACAFEELNIYNQVYDSLFDLSEYLF